MRKPAKLLLTAAAALLLLALALHLLLQPQRVTGFVLNALGDALGLEITATGSSEYRLRGTPVLVVHDMVAREPGAATPLLRARRSEEHTSELTSLMRNSYAVFCLKKKKNIIRESI